MKKRYKKKSALKGGEKATEEKKTKNNINERTKLPLEEEKGRKGREKSGSGREKEEEIGEIQYGY